MKNTSISIGDYFGQFVSSQITDGWYKNVNEIEVVRILRERIDLKNKLTE